MSGADLEAIDPDACRRDFGGVEQRRSSVGQLSGRGDDERVTEPLNKSFERLEVRRVE
jgi:hypothetical protein